MSKVHIGWVKFCRTSTSINTKDDPRFVTPWPCYASFNLEKPPKGDWQFFWKKIFVKNNVYKSS